MSRRSSLALLLALLLFVPIIGSGCESGIDRPTEAPPETRAATALLPADARMMTMVDVQHLQKHGPERARRMLDVPFSNGASAETARLQDFLEASGLNPDRDVERIYMAVSTTDRAPRSVAYGSFDRTRIEDALRSTFGDDLEPSTYREVTLFVASKAAGDQRFALAVPNADMMLAAGTPDALRAMIDRLRDGGDATAPTDLVRKASQGQSFWFVTTDMGRFDEDPGARQDEGDVPGDMRRLGRALKDVAGHFSFTEDGSLDGQFILVPRSSAQAADVADVARGAIAALKQHSEAPDAFREAAQQADVQTVDDEVRVTVTLPAALVDSMAAK